MPGKAGPEIGFGSLFDATSDAPCLCLPCRSPPTHTRQAATARRATCKVASAGHTSTRRCSLRSSAFRTSGREFPRSSCCVPFTDVFCRYEDFAECFSLWCDEQPENAATIFNLVSSRLESSITVSGADNNHGDAHLLVILCRTTVRSCLRSTT